MKILLAVVVALVIIAAAAEFGLRTYLKGQLADEMRRSASEQGIELAADPQVSFGSSPLLLGLARGTIPSLSVDLPSTLDISYQDSDRSRPVVKGQPAATIDLSDMEISRDNPRAGELSMETTLPDDYLLAVINQSMSQQTSQTSPDGDGQAQGATADNLLSGLIQVTGVKSDKDKGTLDVELSGGLATLSMTPKSVDGALSFDVSDVKIFGLSLPEELVGDISSSLTGSVERTENLRITGASVTADGLRVTLHGDDVRLDDITTEVNSTTGTAVNGGNGMAA